MTQMVKSHLPIGAGGELPRPGREPSRGAHVDPQREAILARQHPVEPHHYPRRRPAREEPVRDDVCEGGHGPRLHQPAPEGVVRARGQAPRRGAAPTSLAHRDRVDSITLGGPDCRTVQEVVEGALQRNQM